LQIAEGRKAGLSEHEFVQRIVGPRRHRSRFRRSVEVRVHQVGDLLGVRLDVLLERIVRDHAFVPQLGEVLQFVERGFVARKLGRLDRLCDSVIEAILQVKRVPDLVH
jgi:hypothetical protein